MVDVSSYFDYPDGEGASATDEHVLLAGLSDDEIAILLAHCEIRRLRAGELLIDVGDTDASLYIVTTGLLDAQIHGRRRAVSLAQMQVGDVVGDVSFFDGLPRSARVVAVTDAEVVRLSREAFETLSATHPALGRRILFELARVLAGRVRRLTDTVARMSR